MKFRKSNSIFFMFMLSMIMSLSGFAVDENLSRNDYIEMWKDEAVYQMVVHKIPASITLAQGILESGNGNSTLAKDANNHFGIKCHSAWDGAKVYHDDDKKGECFRSYPDAALSYEDHSIFLKQKRYLGLYDLKINDYKGWAKGLKKAGYATDPKYPKKLIDLIEQNNLTQYDKEGMKYIQDGEMPERGRALPLDGSTKDFVNDPNRPDLGNDNSDEDLPEVSLFKTRSVSNSKNNVPYIFAKEGDTYETIARDLDMMPWQIWKYNDLDKNDKVKEGQKIFIKPKRAKAKAEFHVVQDGETLWSISQSHGIKLKKLALKNNMNPTDSVKPGTKLSLRKKVRS